MKVNKAVIPAAGFGTRMLPVTKAQPKEMVPVFDKPVIQYVIEEAYEAGIDDILIITGRHKRAIEDHFDKHPELENTIKNSEKEKQLEKLNEILENVSIHFIRQKEPRGLGDAIYHARKHVGNEPFVVLLGDVITHPNCTKDLIKNFSENESVISVEKVPKELVSKYGIVAIDEKMQIKDMVEKPSIEKAPSNYAILGRYLLQPEIFDYIRQTPPGKNNEIQLTDALRLMISDNHKMLAHIFSGKVYDIGNKISWLKATVEFALKSEIGEELKKHILSLVAPPVTVPRERRHYGKIVEKGKFGNYLEDVGAGIPAFRQEGNPKSVFEGPPSPGSFAKNIQFAKIYIEEHAKKSLKEMTEEEILEWIDKLNMDAHSPRAAMYMRWLIKNDPNWRLRI